MKACCEGATGCSTGISPTVTDICGFVERIKLYSANVLLNVLAVHSRSSPVTELRNISNRFSTWIYLKLNPNRYPYSNKHCSIAPESWWMRAWWIAFSISVRKDIFSKINNEKTKSSTSKYEEYTGSNSILHGF